MRPVHFTQYLLPNGRQKSISIDMEDEVADKADALVLAGYRFEAEVLSNGVVSLTIVGMKDYGDGEPEEGDVAMELVPNGPGVPAKVKKLIEDFTLVLEQQAERMRG